MSGRREPAKAVDPTDYASKELFEMSDNYRWYVQKMVELRATREINRPLSRDMEEILQVVRECEARWALEDRLGDER